MNIASRLIQIGLIASISVVLANHVGRATVAEIEALYADILRGLEAATRRSEAPFDFPGSPLGASFAPQDVDWSVSA